MNDIKDKQTWSSFYKDRVNNEEYFSYFCKRYNRFLLEILFNINGFSTICPNLILKEEGCGIGNITKALSNVDKSIVNYKDLKIDKIILSDLDNDMLRLCIENLSNIYNGGYFKNVPKIFNKENIFQDKFFESDTVVVTHGVLEHFNDVDIYKILSTYNDRNVLFQAHYVPTNKYTTQSFGDERLLSVEEWVSLVKPTYYIVDNNGCDLYMFIVNC